MMVLAPGDFHSVNHAPQESPTSNDYCGFLTEGPYEGLYSCLFVAAFLPLHSHTVAEMRASLSGGRLSSMRMVSIWMPRNVSWQLGPSVLWAATGTPSS